ncbi:nitroreductase family protein [Ruminiclostridium cellobioparum]|uniref:Nitroreductase n=1 Tax=Ruminiclostridium cellobioparum subsp. termitidis CT1112 TaxID=1195236 RepID=S0FQY3_RUMCE|nr:nitroreductase family protein [Ruminiclostridium cellobioparum]EMS71594.1 nitroreductase [Ruminiclostridium cellobioparum subsp. termitidis CT1112]
MSKDFYNAVKDRRSFYGISKESTVSNTRLQEIVNDAVKYAPTAFNSQSSRVMVLLGVHHDKLWDLTKEELRKLVPPENFSSTESKIDSFKNGYGTVLFFEDQSVVESLQRQFELYKDNFPVWSLESSGMLQYIVWTALELEGFGASLQHYNPLIDSSISREWNIPSNWKLLAQMPFGKPTASPDEKQFQPLDFRVKFLK